MESNKPAAGDEGAVKHLNSLLRGEISAAETYKMAIDTVERADKTTQPLMEQLRSLQEDHGRAAQTLRGRIRELGGEATDHSGLWGAWAQVVEGTMGLFGNTSAIKALKEGEEHGLKDYRDALDEVDATTRTLIEGQCIPAQSRHIGALDQIMARAAQA